jgi:hypothetical protein
MKQEESRRNFPLGALEWIAMRRIDARLSHLFAAAIVAIEAESI